MANISLHDQLRIMSGEVKPPSDTLLTLVHQGGVQYANLFMSNHKVFDTDDGADPPVSKNVDATDYLNKMVNICARIFRTDSNAINSLMRIIVVLMAEALADIETIENANDALWEAFIETRMLAAFELSASITKEERDEYNILP